MYDNIPRESRCFAADRHGSHLCAHGESQPCDTPAYALWTRHVDGVTLKGYQVIPEGEEKRPEWVFGEDSQVEIQT